MRKINKTDVIKIMFVLTLVAGTGLALGSVGRFTPTHMIVQEVYCGSCHPEQVQELNATTHLAGFAGDINALATSQGVTLAPAEAISDGCTMCHNFWENMKWFGVRYNNVTKVATDKPAPYTDIYGNVVSPYGLSSTYSWNWTVNVTDVVSTPVTVGSDNSHLVAEPWGQGIDSYKYTDANGTHYRLDYVWSNLSSLSPGPVGYNFKDTTGAIAGCGNDEKGLCHIAKSAIVQSELGNRPEILNQSAWVGANGGGSGVFFRHEMAYTTAQYAAKPVKICGACHVNKLPPMAWGGEPWSQGVIEQLAGISGPFTANPTNPDDPFGFTPEYNQVGTANLVGHGHDTGVQFVVNFKTPDWAHANVPCIRCHVHAGLTGTTVSNISADAVGISTGP